MSSTHGLKESATGSGGGGSGSGRESTAAAGTRLAEATRLRILDAARAVLAEGGTLSARVVAARAGVSRQTIHNRFGGLAGLRGALADAGFDAGAPPGDTRERILAAALTALSRPSGAGGIDEIAAEAGLTKGAIYHHFADRGALLRAVADRVSPIDDMVAALEGTATLTDQEALAALLRAYHTVVAARSDLLRNLVMAGSGDPELARLVFRQILLSGAPVLLGWYRERASRGGYRAVHPSLVFQAMFGPAFVHVLFGPFLEEVLSQIGGRPVAEVADQYADLILGGLQPRAALQAGGT